MKVLVSDKLAEEGIEILKQAGDIQVDVKTGLAPEELKKIIGDYEGIIIRSGTKLTADVLAGAEKMKVIARAGVGVDNIDIPAASKKGIIVMNTPGGNTTSTAEHTFALMLALARNIPQAYNSLKEGKWDRKKFSGSQLAGKTIGIVGLGRVGLEVAKKAVAFDMKVVGFDPYISETVAAKNQITLVSDVKELFKDADFVTVHTPLTPETKDLINDEALAIMKDGVRVINCARGGIINEESLLKALDRGKAAGAAFDVYTEEPPKNRALVEHEKVLCTPHLGASTKEAQIIVAIDAAKQLVNALKGTEIKFAINYPYIEGKEAEQLKPYIMLGMKLGSMAGQLLKGRVNKLKISYAGDVCERRVEPISTSAIMGFLKEIIGVENVNMVSAPYLARERDIEVVETKDAVSEDFANMITLEVATDAESRKVAGTLFRQNDPRIILIDDFEVETIPDGDILVLQNADRPGFIGEVGKILGVNNINIARMTFGRKAEKGDAITILNLDAKPSEEVLKKIADIENVSSVTLVRL